MPSQLNSNSTEPVIKTNLLLVDDQPNNLVVLEAVLSGPEYNLFLADSGPKAIEILQKEDIALVLLDVQMPVMDGFQTARVIKTMDHCKDVPIIFITAVYKEDAFVKKGYQAGAIDYFSKPFDPEILKLKVGLYSSFRQKTYLMKEREKRLKETEELLKTGRKLSGVLEHLPVGVLIADSEGRICQVNEEVSRIWGFQESLKNDSYGEFLRWWENEGKLLKSSQGPMSRAITRGETSQNEITRIKCYDGKIKTVVNSASPLKNLEGQVVGVVVIIQDITEHKQIEQDMEQRIQRLITLGVELEQSVRH